MRVKKGLKHLPFNWLTMSLLGKKVKKYSLVTSRKTPVKFYMILKKRRKRTKRNPNLLQATRSSRVDVVK
jgi:hypothetical protein